MGLGPCFLALILNGVSDAPSSQCCGLMVSGSKPCSSKGGAFSRRSPFIRKPSSANTLGRKLLGTSNSLRQRALSNMSRS